MERSSFDFRFFRFATIHPAGHCRQKRKNKCQYEHGKHTDAGAQKRRRAQRQRERREEDKAEENPAEETAEEKTED